MKSISEYIFEKLGKILECENICYEIIEDISNNMLKNIYAFVYKKQTITIYIKTETNNNGNLTASYIKSLTDYDKNIITINVYYDPKNFNKEYCFELLGHEILHGGEDLIFQYEMTTELKNVDRIIRSFYNGITISNTEKHVSQYVYLLNYHERHAYMSQLTDNIRKIIQDHNWNLNTFNNKIFKRDLLTLSPWNVYFSFDKFIVKFNEDIDYLKAYNNITETNSTIKDAIKNLTRKYIKFKKKFETLVSKITFDVLYERTKQDI